MQAKNPPFILLENVDRLLKSPASMRGRDFGIMLKVFDQNGYYVTWRVINAGEYNMPQKRRRVFIFAFKKDGKYAQKFAGKDGVDLLSSTIFNEVFPVEEITSAEITDLTKYKDILEVSNGFDGGKFLTAGFMKDGIAYHCDITPIVEDIFTLEKVVKNAKEYIIEDKNEYAVEDEKLDKWKYLKGPKRIERVAKTGHSYIYSEGGMAFPEKMDEPARTMLTSEGTLNRSSHIIYDNELAKYRILTPVECEMIQMFPPNWTDTMPRRNRYFMMGNALVTGIIRRLEPVLKEIIENE